MSPVDTAARLHAFPVERAQEWIDEFVIRPHEELRRPGPVCPFVETAIKGRTFHLEEQQVAADIDVDGLLHLVRRAVRAFEEMRWEGGNRMLQTMVWVLAGLPEEGYVLLDKAQALAKPEVVARGLMVAQFHPDCDDRAARNPDFRASRSPVPLLAIRRMSLHDVLFLGSDPEWFAVYQERFGKRYRQGSVTDPLFVESFEAARARWGTA